MAAGILSEAILIIASIIIAGSMAGVVLSQVGVFESTFTATSEGQKDKVLTKVEVIYATNSTNTVNAWTKNTGISPITNLDSVDVYFGQIDAVQRIPYNTGSSPQWVYNGGAPSSGIWQKMDTLQIDVTDGNTLQTNVTYMIIVTTPNGISDDYIFTLTS